MSFCIPFPPRQATFHTARDQNLALWTDVSPLVANFHLRRIRSSASQRRPLSAELLISRARGRRAVDGRKKTRNNSDPVRLFSGVTKIGCVRV